jgi:cell division septal protein FtsQ
MSDARFSGPARRSRRRRLGVFLAAALFWVLISVALAMVIFLLALVAGYVPVEEVAS